MKKIIKRGLPLFLACLILVGVPLTSYENVKASGVEEYLYYTYWDLMTSIFAAQGYDMQVKDSVVNTHGVTGKQVWHNFTTWVKTNAKKVYDEAVALPKIVTAEGIKMSQDLWDAFREYAESLISVQNNKVSTTNALPYGFYPVIKMCRSVYQSEADATTGVFSILSSTSNLHFVYCQKDSSTYIFYCYSSERFSVDCYSEDQMYCGSNVLKAGNYYFSELYAFSKVVDPSFFEYINCSITSYLYSLDKVPTVDVVQDSDIYSIVSQGACPAEVPDVSPWIKNPTIPDEWRIVQPGEVPEKDPDNNPEKVPVIIPFKPPKPQKPEKPDSTEETNPDKDKDKDKKKKPAVNPIINPQTGNVIDPETGLDIDPDTGKLIDPDTGKLIDPDDGGSGGGGGGGIADKLGKYGDITKLFPFCIPFDIVNLIKGMSAEKAPPVFHFKYYFKSINYTFKVDVDLSKYAKYIKLFRYGMQIFYILALMFMTIRISKLFS